MTAIELIEQLKHLPPQTKVVVRGYEEGYNVIMRLKPIKIIHSEKNEWYYGEYIGSNNTDAVQAVELFGENTRQPPE